MKTLKVCTLAFASLLAVAASAKTVTMTRATLQDKIKGGWAGQTIGCAFGGPTEFKYNGKIIPDETKIVWDDTRVKHYFDTFPGLYDDIYMDLTFVEVFEKKGLDAPISEFAHAFANAKYPLWHANQSARYNILQGMESPASGHWKNNPHADDIDFQIEADYAGLMAPGMPQAAAYYTDSIGHIMCYGDGWYGGVYVATMFSLAFISNDVDYIVTEALKAIPCALVGSPEGIARMGEGMGKRRGGRVEPQPFIDLHEGQVHVDVVIQSGERVEVVAHQGVVPGYRHRVGNHAAGILELCGSAIGYADGLANPSAPDFVCQGRAAQRHGLGSCPHGHSRHQGDERYSHSVCHNWYY